MNPYVFGPDLQDVDVEQVARLGAIDVDRPGERVDEVEVDVRDVIEGRAGVELPVERVARLEDHLVAGVARRRRAGCPDATGCAPSRSGR